MKNEKGFSLIETMVTVSFLAISVGAITSKMGYNSKSNNAGRLALTRDNLSKQISRVAGSLTALKKSMNRTGNQELLNCIDGIQNTVCTSTAGEVGFYLTDLFTATDMSGTPTAPVYYDGMGLHCDPQRQLCALSAFATFRATCSNNAATCANADGVNITYNVTIVDPRHSKTATNGKETRMLVDDRVNQRIYTQVMQLNSTGTLSSISCGAAYVRGINADGSLDCVAF